MALNPGLAKYPNILPGFGQAVDEYCTPEEKNDFAQFLAAQHGKRPLEELGRVAGMAGLLDLDADWKFIIAASDPASELAVRNLEGVQEQRLCFAELGKQMGGIGESPRPRRSARNQLLGSAMRAYRNAGDLKSEIRIAMAPGFHGGLTEEDMRALAIADPQQLVQIARGSFAESRNQAVNAAIASGNVRLAMDAVAARGQAMPPLWADALTALTGLYYSPQGPDVTAVFQRMLGTANIGQLLVRAVDRDKQLVGDPWFCREIRATANIWRRKVRRARKITCRRCWKARLPMRSAIPRWRIPMRSGAARREPWRSMATRWNSIRILGARMTARRCCCGT